MNDLYWNKILGIDENNEEAAHKHNLCIKLLKEKQVNESMLSARKNFKFSKKLQNQNEANSEDYETLTVFIVIYIKNFIYRIVKQIVLILKIY